MTALYISLAAAAFILAVLTAAAAVTYKITFYRNPKKHKADPYYGIGSGPYAVYEPVSRALVDRVLTLPYEDVFIKSYDGLKLRGRYYHKDDSAPIVIQFHGYKSTPMKDFSGAGVMSLDFGYNVIMIDQRAHGMSEGRTITFGGKEMRDCLSWIEYVGTRFGKDRKILLQGISMGAATVLLASAAKLPQSVRGIMADCPYSSAKEIISKEISGRGLPPAVFYPLLRAGALLFGRFDPNRVDVAEAVKKSRIPILLIHGEADDFVPCDMSRKIAAGCKSIEFYTFPGAAHGISYLLDTERYLAYAEEFAKRVLSDAK